MTFCNRLCRHKRMYSISICTAANCCWVQNLVYIKWCKNCVGVRVFSVSCLSVLWHAVAVGGSHVAKRRSPGFVAVVSVFVDEHVVLSHPLTWGIDTESTWVGITWKHVRLGY